MSKYNWFFPGMAFLSFECKTFETILTTKLSQSNIEKCVYLFTKFTKQNAANFYKSRKNTFFVVLQIQNTSVNKLDMVLQNLNFLTIHNGELFGQSKKFHIDSFSKYP